MENKKVDPIKMQRMISKGIMMTDIEENSTSAPPLVLTDKEVSCEIASSDDSEQRPITERPKRKSSSKGDYESIFLHMNELKDRKAVYISRELHQEIAHFLGTIKSGELSVGAYIENIINNHLEMHKDEMDALYESKFKKPSQRFKR